MTMQSAASPNICNQPVVSVIVATYNRSAVLQYAIKSVLAQTFKDFELLIIGDCCTDNTEEVVQSFKDNRIHWHNLETNCGNQFGPNNQGLQLARGRYIAYLGHDDLWYPNHLSRLVHAIEEQNADLVFALTEEIGPPEMPSRTLMGVCPSGVYEWSIWPPPSSWLHRQDVINSIGLWRDYKSIILPTDVDFLDRVYNSGCRIVPVNELTVFKFTSVLRTNSYLDNRCDEQANWWERLCQEPDFCYRELIEILISICKKKPDILTRFSLPNSAKPGSLVESYRARRGLPPSVKNEQVNSQNPLFLNHSILRYLNAEDDIGPGSDQTDLHNKNELPIDGLFLGFNWYSLEKNDELRWRWIDTEAQIVITRPTGLRRTIQLDLTPGPGIHRLPCVLQALDISNKTVAEVSIEGAGKIDIDLPITEGKDAIFSLVTENGGRTIQGDPRILNFRVFSLRWS